ncbi:dTDP-4-dehydrorhamnose reductase [Haemophilus parainfluenzae]|uniref:dTDP-4-dehydrorhamnose reductase n=1 Tax=Haemophilus parainfluenzae TaxID=729 RepID=A0A377JIE3_HAEPA|nr:dTDP-4-dehydrorhamnose reductase [Haemophilus parainfluenzae]MBS6284386.1 dTDP-4-dehydrorhamnose reductase [Haemophilus parainfluenzae]STP05503.1 dTDP-D-glucose 4,6-dehydratase [Haemophilus parainfluenzae]
MAKLLITGANGQVGFILSQKLRNESKHEVLALSHAELDITNKEAVSSIVDSFAPDVIINCAAYTDVDKAESKIKLAYDVNMNGVKYLAEAANKCNATILHISTDYVFDGGKTDKYTEKDIIHPISVYGSSKAKGDTILLSLSPKAIILRTSWVFGEHGNNFVKTILGLAKSKDTLAVVSDQIGGPTYAKDVATALIYIAEQIIEDGNIRYGIYNFAGKPCVSWYDFSKTIFEEAVSQNVLEKSPLVNAITTADYPTPAKRPLNSCLDLTKIQQVFGIQPSDWQAALKNIKAYIE